MKEDRRCRVSRDRVHFRGDSTLLSPPGVQLTRGLTRLWTFHATKLFAAAGFI
jgi:hypothetical protein